MFGLSFANTENNSEVIFVGKRCLFMVQFIAEGSKAALNTNSAQFKRSV
jgi:hypothetical protein